MKKWIVLPLLLLSFYGHAGINFEHLTWEEAKEKAAKAGKLIFVDFFTEWCGPCLAMAEEVFPLPEVGDIYNTNFLNLKIDAEKGEGRTLREKYNVVSFPAFVFIDPVTEEAVHRSSSRQDAATFIFTGKSALDPEMRSFFLEREYSGGNRSAVLMKRYMDYLASIYQRDKVTGIVAEYTSREDFSLENDLDWEVFVRHINGIGNSYFDMLQAEYVKYTAVYGREVVDKKLFREFNTSGDFEKLRQSPEFQGKQFLLRKNQAEAYIKAKNYELAVPLLAELMADPGEFKEELCNYLRFTARSILYGEHSDFWIRQCAGYAQYAAYHSYDRRDAAIHYDYAVILEKIIRRMPEAGRYFPESILKEPAKGSTGYSIRSPKLKQKPLRK